MTPDEFRKKDKSCFYCKYYYKNTIVNSWPKCRIRFCDVLPLLAETCVMYEPIPFEEEEK